MQRRKPTVIFSGLIGIFITISCKHRYNHSCGIDRLSALSSSTSLNLGYLYESKDMVDETDYEALRSILRDDPIRALSSPTTSVIPDPVLTSSLAP